MAMAMREKMQERREVSRGREFCFVFSFFCFLFLQAREAAKSGLVVFDEALQEFMSHKYLEKQKL
jgi:hypothetical protein